MTEIIHEGQFMITRHQTERGWTFRFWRLEQEISLLDDYQVEARIEQIRRSIGSVK